VLATLDRHPALIPQFEAALDRLDLPPGDLAAVRDALLSAAAGTDPAAHWAAARPAVADALDRIARHPHVRSAPCVGRAATEALAARCVADDLERLASWQVAASEIGYAEAEISGFSDEGVTWRLARAAEARLRAERTPLDEPPEEGAGTGERTGLIDRLLASEAWRKRQAR
jgi:DNA primase